MASEDALKAYTWLTDHPDEMRVLVREKLDELEPEIIRLNEEIRANLREALKRPDDINAWVEFEYPTEEMERRLKNLENQVKRFRHYDSILNPSADRITDDDIERARQYPLENLINQPLKSAGAGKKKCCCPFHPERTPSFMVYTDQNSFHCYSCQKNGNAIDFVMETEGLSFRDTVLKLRNY